MLGCNHQINTRLLWSVASRVIGFAHTFSFSNVAYFTLLRVARFTTCSTVVGTVFSAHILAIQHLGRTFYQLLDGVAKTSLWSCAAFSTAFGEAKWAHPSWLLTNSSLNVTFAASVTLFLSVLADPNSSLRATETSMWFFGAFSSAFLFTCRAFNNSAFAFGSFDDLLTFAFTDFFTSRTFKDFLLSVASGSLVKTSTAFTALLVIAGTDALEIQAETSFEVFPAFISTTKVSFGTDPSVDLIANSTFQFLATRLSTQRFIFRTYPFVFLLIAATAHKVFLAVSSTFLEARITNHLFDWWAAFSILLLVLTNSTTVDVAFFADILTTGRITTSSNRAVFAFIIANSFIISTNKGTINADRANGLFQALSITKTVARITFKDTIFAFSTFGFYLTLAITEF